MNADGLTIAIASGKGGTGKTTLAVNLAYALSRQRKDVRLLDCDVEQPNAHLFVRLAAFRDVPVEVAKPRVDREKCVACGACREACRFNALALMKRNLLVFPELCHACGACIHVCPQGALSEEPSRVGVVRVACASEPFFFAYGELSIGETLSTRVIQAVKQQAAAGSLNLVDASPGTSCPVVESVRGADVAILVTEPTPFGLYDLRLAAEMAATMGIPIGIVINRSVSGDSGIDAFAATAGIPVIGRIPFSRAYAQSYAGGHVLVDHHPELKDLMIDIFEHARQLAGGPSPSYTIQARSEPPAEPAPDTLAESERTCREIVVISGKGGTGKTTLVGAFAVLAKDKVLSDADVDAPDLHLLLKPATERAYAFSAGTRAEINSRACVGCGRCAEACRFGAVTFDGPANDVIGKTYRIDPLVCEGCGLCRRVCPADAVQEWPRQTGTCFISETRVGPMAHAQLAIAEENSGKLVAAVRQNAARVAADRGHMSIVTDGPPGVGCPVIATVSGADLVVVVTEPTVSGVHDMRRVLQLAGHFDLPAVVVINKADICPEYVDRIEDAAHEFGSRVVARIPFDEDVNAALLSGMTVVEYGTGAAATVIRDAWNAIVAAV